MEFFCFHRDRPGSGALRHGLLEEHWSYMDGYASAIIARGPTYVGDTITGSVHIVDLPDPGAARSSAFDEPGYQAGGYRDVLLRRWAQRARPDDAGLPWRSGRRQPLPRTRPWLGRASRPRSHQRRTDRLRAAASDGGTALAGYGGAGPRARLGHSPRRSDPGSVRRDQGPLLAVRRTAHMSSECAHRRHCSAPG